jgi:hypothetical protein
VSAPAWMGVPCGCGCRPADCEPGCACRQCQPGPGIDFQAGRRSSWDPEHTAWGARRSEGAVARTRMVALLQRDALTPDEQDELDQLLGVYVHGGF